MNQGQGFTFSGSGDKQQTLVTTTGCQYNHLLFPVQHPRTTRDTTASKKDVGNLYFPPVRIICYVRVLTNQTTTQQHISRRAIETPFGTAIPPHFHPVSHTFCTDWSSIPVAHRMWTSMQQHPVFHIHMKGFLIWIIAIYAITLLLLLRLLLRHQLIITSVPVST